MKNDVQIQKDVMEQLKWEPFVKAAEIGVSVKEGIVTLSGQVDSYLKKVSAENAARKVAGVRGIAEDIQIGVSPVYQKTDTEIATSAANALKWHSAVPDQMIRVKVEDGVVTLEGAVEWDFQRTAAKNAVFNLLGVKRVINNITLTPAISIADIKSKIVAAFHRSATIDAQRISIETVGTKVILRGKVRSYAEKEDAESAAWAAQGITTVENYLQLVPEEEYTF